MNPSHVDLTIGGFAVASPVNFQGLVDEVRLHSRTLSAVEIRVSWQRFTRPAAPGDPPAGR